MAKLILAPLLLLLLASAPSPAQNLSHSSSRGDRVSFGDDITVNEDETAGDLVCIVCSVHLHGDVHGDIVTLFGSLTVDDGRNVSGDVVGVGGDISLGEAASIKGSVDLVAGDLDLAPSATVHKDRTVLPGRLWLLLPLAPFLLLAGVIWLIVWIVRRARYRPPYYPTPIR